MHYIPQSRTILHNYMTSVLANASSAVVAAHAEYPWQASEVELVARDVGLSVVSRTSLSINSGGGQGVEVIGLCLASA